jgi:DNA-binding NarL/FixJ family response regulator
VRVLVVDDQELVRAGIRLVLGADEGIEVVGERADGDEVIDAVAMLRPDVVLLDVRMARMDGIVAMRALQAANGADLPPVLVLTTFGDDEVLWGALDAGAAGFLLKDSPPADIVRAVRTVADGAAWIDPSVTGRLLAVLRSRHTADPDAQRKVAALSDRERQVLSAMAGGATNTEIAERLHLSERTVKAHVGSIFLKLEARDRAAAIIIAHAARTT